MGMYDAMMKHVHDRAKKLEAQGGRVMHWTTEKPTKPGWYWMKDGSAVVVVLIEIGTFDSTYVEWVWQTGSRRQTPLSVFTDREWAGPIPEPTERAEGRDWRGAFDAAKAALAEEAR